MAKSHDTNTTITTVINLTIDKSVFTSKLKRILAFKTDFITVLNTDAVLQYPTLYRDVKLSRFQDALISNDLMQIGRVILSVFEDHQIISFS